ncbi:MAG: hypothetical protein Q4E70_01950 [Candidatus Saccharibacteria bacterium]|nr:hypothetical protein [Candidatus Saccharibacteria bacterium]
MSEGEYSVIIPNSVKPRPSTKELSAADIMMEFFKSDVKIVRRSSNKTPDFLIKGVYWELKSPTGSGKHNIQHNLQDAGAQSANVILDGRKSKIHPNRLKIEVNYQFQLIKKIKRLIFIDKNGKAVELFRKK